MRKFITYILTAMLIAGLMVAPAFAKGANLDFMNSKESVSDLAKLIKESEIAVEPVSKVTAKLKSSEKVAIEWSRVSEADGYNLYKKDGSDIVFVTSVRDTNAVVSSKVTKGKTNEFVVKAYVKESGEKKLSEAETAKVYVPSRLKRSTPGFAQTNAGKMMTFAKTKVGCAYVSGAEGPNAFDCSGFAYYVIKKAGTIKVPRSSAAGLYSAVRQYNIGSRKFSDAQPGDLVFCSRGGGISHVAFYYGDGKLLHATNPRCGVAITPTSWSGHVVAIVRLPNM